jgi:alkylation response protein AidB-like acyl-CoA dehydrogenase
MLNFDLSPEQLLMKEAAERYLRDAYSFDARRRILASDEGISRVVWRRMGEFGWLGLPLSEAAGGMGGSPIDLMVLAEQMGRALVVEPWLAGALLAGRLVDRLGTAEQRRRVLQPLIAGETFLAFAHLEADARFDLAGVRTIARRHGGGWVLDGAKTLALAAPLAESLVVSARTAGVPTDADGISLFLLRREAPGVSMRPYRSVDGHSAADLVFSSVAVPDDALLGNAGRALTAIETVVDEATVAMCAEAVGAMERANEITLEYLKTREQFGQKIGKFQALQHRMVDLFMEAELSRSIVIAATIKLDEGADDAKNMISAAKVRIGKAGKLVGTQGVQLHGGMGMTLEYPIGHYYRRLLAIETMFGNTAFHRARLVQASRAALADTVPAREQHQGRKPR